MINEQIIFNRWKVRYSYHIYRRFFFNLFVKDKREAQVYLLLNCSYY